MTGAPDAGFADPVHDAQRCFRDVLTALSRPGTLARVGGVAPPAPLCVAAGAVLLTLADHETPLWIDPAGSGARDWLAFHCGTAGTAEPGACVFGLAQTLPDLARFSAGTHEEPETSATIVCQVESFDHGRVYRLEGPGLREPATLTVAGLPEDFAAIWARNRVLFPRGIDLILCAGDRLAALPRTVSIQKV